MSIAEVKIKKIADNEIILQQLASNVISGNQSRVKKEINHALHAGIPACTILNEGMIRGMTVLGRMFRDNEVYVPQVIMAAQAMETGLKILKPFLSEFHLSYRGKVVIGTIQYDIHDLGKNIVGIFLESSGFKVLDLGVDVPTGVFCQSGREGEAGSASHLCNDDHHTAVYAGSCRSCAQFPRRERGENTCRRTAGHPTLCQNYRCRCLWC